MAMKYKGVGTALITPRDERGWVNVLYYSSLLERQVQAGIDFVVVLGTTGEAEFLPTSTSSSTLNPEHSDYRGRLICETGDKLRELNKRNKVPVVVGTSAIDPKEVIERTERVRLLADAALITPPPYVKPRQNGIVNHYAAIAAALNTFPLIAYNVPGRVGVNIDPETLRLLMKIPTIMGVKEASGNMSQMEAYATVRAEEGRDHEGSTDYFYIWSGDDATAFQAVQQYGADGVISVVSNVAPIRMREVIHAALKKDERGSSLDVALQPLYKASMLAGNPQSIKYIMERAGYTVGLPHPSLGTPTSEEEEAIDSLIHQVELS